VAKRKKLPSARLAARRFEVAVRCAGTDYEIGLRHPRRVNTTSGPITDLKDAATKYILSAAAGSSAYARGFAPYRAILAKLKLPRKYKRGDPRNYRRTLAIAQALHAEKVRREKRKHGIAHGHHPRRADEQAQKARGQGVARGATVHG